MRVLVAAASFSANISGIQRHAVNIARCLLQLREISAVHFVVAPWQRGLVQSAGFKPDSRFSIHIAEMSSSSLSRNRWYYCSLPELAVRIKADVVHLSFPMPIHGARFGCPTIVTLHDLYPYEIPLNFGFPKFVFNRLTLRQCLYNADAIACVSEATNTRLKQYMPAVVWRKAVRIYNCVEAEPLCSEHSPIPGWQGEPFLLCVSQHRRNKNIPLLIRAFDRLLRSVQINTETKLVVIGIAGPETRSIHRLVSTKGLERSVHFLEGVSEAELQWCYMRAEALIAPSRTEGFGLPVAEALLAGCRVVCSDIPAHREAGGGHCQFVALGEKAEETLAAAIITVLHEPSATLISLPQFSASVLAAQYLDLYSRLVASDALQKNTHRFDAKHSLIKTATSISAEHQAVPASQHREDEYGRI